MEFLSNIRLSRSFSLIAAVFLVVLTLPVLADTPENTITEPGFRPYSEYAPAFLHSLPTATIAVYPSVVRRSNRTAHSFASREQIVSLLTLKNIAIAVAETTRIDLGGLQRRPQWELFQNGMHAIADELKSQHSVADYKLILEVVLHPNNQSVFGIHFYILDQQGRNAFSFLLNSHHQSFHNAKLTAEDSSEAARIRLMERATQLGVAALQAQIELAGDCATHTELGPLTAHAGVFDDFEASLRAGTDKFGIPLGFVTFSDGSSAINVSTTADYPTLPRKTGSNTVLQLDMDVTSWAALAHIFENYTVDQWISFDWSAFDEFSFWFYGKDSGTALFVDVLDNRQPCSTVDDAERYVYEFVDDFSGWERVSIRFADMTRKEVGNGAPNDGLNLSTVHGWAIGTLNTGGLTTFYIDDITLRNTVSQQPDYAINELPMYAGREKTAAQKRADKAYIKRMTRGGKSRAAAAESAARVGWNRLYKEDRSAAIKRFNQAWLLDPNNQLALWGFAVISAERGEIEEAVRFFRMAIENGPENSSLQRDYEFALKEINKN